MAETMTDGARFDLLLRRFLDGLATGEERAAFCKLLRDRPERVAEYAGHLELLAVTRCLAGAGAVRAGLLPPIADGGRRISRWRASARANSRVAWRKVAVAAAMLLVGATVWLGVRKDTGVPILDLPLSEVSPPVRIVRQSGVRGLDLPQALPGTVRLDAGEVVVRLASGVELTLLGTVRLDVLDAMRVTLESGRLLANVPHWATGFIVNTEFLEIWDLGTVFGVSAESGSSDVFVFKGSVQVNEASGGGVGICEAGEGVMAMEGLSAEKIAADWDAAREAFAAVRGDSALKNPGMALVVAGKVADLWQARYASALKPVKRVRTARGTASRQGVAPKEVRFSKSAWVRPDVPTHQGESSMNITRAVAALSATAIMTGAEMAGAVSKPTMIDTSWYDRRWMTVYTNTVPLVWDWNADATHAELSVNGMGGSFTTNFTSGTSGYLWEAFATRVPAVEDVYDLTLTFYNGNDAVVGELTARLAVVTGAFGNTAVNTSPGDRKWTSVRDNVVIPYDAGWAAATADAAVSRLVIAKSAGPTQTHTLADASGYFGWRLKNSGWGYGTFGLSLSFPEAEGEWTASLSRVPGGTLISVR